jgi:hypothetical protein
MTTGFSCLDQFGKFPPKENFIPEAKRAVTHKVAQVCNLPYRRFAIGGVWQRQ